MRARISCHLKNITAEKDRIFTGTGLNNAHTCVILWDRAGRNIEVLDGNGKQDQKLIEA